MKLRPPAQGPLTPLRLWLINNPELATIYILCAGFVVLAFLGSIQ